MTELEILRDEIKSLKKQMQDLFSENGLIRAENIYLQHLIEATSGNKEANV